ncbi:regulatory protein RecX [Pseudomonadota bacterium]
MPPKKDSHKALEEYALKILGGKRYSMREMQEKLEKRIKNPKHSGTDEDIYSIIEKLKKYKYLDDEDYAAVYISDQLKRKPQGLRLLKTSLSLKGIPAEIVARALDGKEIDEITLAASAAEKKKRSLGKFAPQVQREKLYRFLLSRGFNTETILRVL